MFRFNLISVLTAVVLIAIGFTASLACQKPNMTPEQAVEEQRPKLERGTYLHDRTQDLCFFRYTAVTYLASSYHYTWVPCTDEVLAVADPEFLRLSKQPPPVPDPEPTPYGPEPEPQDPLALPGQHCCGAHREGCKVPF